MKRFLFILLVFPLLLFSQNDTLINNGLYQVRYSIKYHIPLIVQYTLSNGGGECDRTKMEFKSYSFTAKDIDYKGTGYDRGHMVNAEDFAFDCEKEKKTFEYYNVVPQTHHLNAGVFKHYETIIRTMSHEEHIKITIINVTDTIHFIGNNIHKVLYTYKVVRSVKTNEVLLIVKFDSSTEVAIELPLTSLEPISVMGTILKQ